MFVLVVFFLFLRIFFKNNQPNFININIYLDIK